MTEQNPKKTNISKRNFTTLQGFIGAGAAMRHADHAANDERVNTHTMSGAIATLPTVAALRMHEGTETASHAVVLGYYQPDDGGGGLFHWVPTATEPDNGGTIIAAGGTGRWQRVLGQPGIVDLAWFGATVGDGVGLINRIALTNALQWLAARGGGTLLVSRLYPLGDMSDPGWMGIGIGLPATDGGVLSTSIDDLSLIGTVAGAGFRFVRPTGAPTRAGLKLSGCRSFTLRGITLDGNLQDTELVSLRNCLASRVFECTFQNAFHTISVEMIGGSHNTVESNHFLAGGGLKLGDAARAGDHEENAQVLSNRFQATGQIAGNRVPAIQAAIRHGVISHNSFSGTAGGIALLSAQLTAEVCDSLAIAGNTFVGCDYGVRSLPQSTAGPPVPTRGLSIVGNTIDGAGGAACGWEPAVAIYSSADLVISGNVLKDCDSAYAIDLRSVTRAVISDNVVALDKPTTQRLPQQPWGIQFSNVTTETRDLSISGNVVRGYAGGIGGGSHGGATCSNVAITGNSIARSTGGPTLGIRVDADTPAVSLVGNRIEPGATFDYVLFSTCRMAANMGKVTVFDETSYFEDRPGQRTFAPALSPPANPPAGLSFEPGDIVYNAAPMTGTNLGWVWTRYGQWRPFGAIG